MKIFNLFKKPVFLFVILTMLVMPTYGLLVAPDQAIAGTDNPAEDDDDGIFDTLRDWWGDWVPSLDLFAWLSPTRSNL